LPITWDERCQIGDAHINVRVENSLNRRRAEVEVAVTTVLAEKRLTPWDVFGD